MEIKEFSKQINRGLGSIILLLKNNQKENRKYSNAIKWACKNNKAYDPQCEGSKAQYLWEIIQLSGKSESIQKYILQALGNSDRGYDILQMFELARLFSDNGNIMANAVMRKQFKYHEPWNCFIGAEEIIKHEGIASFRFVMETTGEKILSDNEYSEDEMILDFACDTLGNDLVYNLLGEELPRNELVKAYYDSTQA